MRVYVCVDIDAGEIITGNYFSGPRVQTDRVSLYIYRPSFFLPSLVDVYLILSYDTIKTIMQYDWGILIHFQKIDVYSSNPHM